MRRSLVRAAALTAGLLTAPGLGAQEISNAELFRKSLNAAEKALEFYGSWEDRQEMRRVAEIGYRVAAASGYRDFPFSFYLVDMPVPNAFALPGGHIFLTRGMLDLGLDDDMLAGLLGHEIGHVVRQHGMKIQRRATLLNVLSQALLLGVLISADSGTSPSPVPGPAYDRGASPGERVVGAAATGVVVSELLLRSYSREFEDEADDEGQRMAAAAGYDPDGTRRLMALMSERLPESKQYGYWRTHPFFDQRVRAAAVREQMLKIQQPAPPHPYRQETQRVLLAYREKKPLEDPQAPDLIERAALSAWPVGDVAERLRLKRLHRERDREMAERELYRDLGRLIGLYREEAAEIAELDPDADLLPALEREIGAFERQLGLTYPKAAEILGQGVFETEFLETFQSNYPEAPELPAVALALGNAYSRLGRPTEAVHQYLVAWRHDPSSEAGIRARRGLRNLAPQLERLGALQQLVDLEEDNELQSLASERLAVVAKRFKELDNGADFLKRYPDSPLSATVNDRLNALADDLYGEVVLYQAVGDHVKALDRIQRILTEAPLSRAAERLRQSAVLEG